MPLDAFPRMLRLALLLSALFFCGGCEERSGVKIGDTPPPIAGTDLRGRPVSLAGLRGRLVMVYFWTDSCCSDDLKELEPVYRRYRGQGLEVLAVNSLDTEETVRSFAARSGITFTMLRDEGSDRFRAYNVLGFPTIYLVDRSGVVREKILGHIGIARLEQLVKRQLEAGRKAEESYRKLHEK